MENTVNEARIRSQAWKFYFVLFAWTAYLFLLPMVYAKAGYWCILYMIFPGIYLFTWAGYMMHETWHKYVPNIPNDLFYNLYAWTLITDPQVYRAVHGFHHSKVHTWDDTEFHPVGEIKNRFLRAVYNFFEIFVGIIFISLLAQFVMPGHPVHGKKFKAWKALLSLLFVGIFLAGIGLLSHLAFGVSAKQVIIPFIASIWLNSFIVHHSQMIEHGNLIVDGSFDQRNIWARNLRDTAWPEKVFLFFTHGDSREHVLHHTMTSVYSRPFPHEIALPKNSVYINLKEYMGVLGRMFKGVTDTEKPRQENQE